jgi:Flp pilus assembly protein protease CpaA
MKMVIGPTYRQPPISEFLPPLNFALQQMIWFPLAMTILAAACDLRRREIPDSIPLVLLVAAGLAITTGWSTVGVGSAIAGCCLGFGMSAVLFWVGAWGGGDVKLLAALGAWLGPAALLAMCFWMAVVGAALAIAAGMQGRRDLAYAPAIACGLLVQSAWPDALSHLAGF